MASWALAFWALAVAWPAGPAAAAERGPDPVAADCPPGFTAVPGTRTCLRIGGRVRAEMGAGRGGVQPGAQGRVTVDARTPTDLGPVRTFLQLGTGTGR